MHYSCLLSFLPILFVQGMNFLQKRDIRSGHQLQQRQVAGPKPNVLHKHDTAKTQKFAVNGTSLPLVDFDIGESYAGLLPISEKPDDPQQLYFWYFPSQNPQASNEITIWLNGGPGASSLEGFLQENGPIQWQFGTFQPVPNPWTWVNLTNVVWIEQPVGTGFSLGNASATTEEDVASQFLGFFRNFIDTFDMHGREVYIAGESYGGMYVPHIADAMFQTNDTKYFNLQATMLVDPLINSDPIETQIPAASFMNEWSRLLGLNATFLQSVNKQADICGYTKYLEDHLVYPPKGPLPEPPSGGNCNLWESILDAATLVNPCFDIYQIATTCPLLYDPMGFPGTITYLPHGAKVYFDMPDVKNAINAPQIPWGEASPRKLYNTSSGYSFENDNNISTSFTLLPRVIERSKRTLIGHGGLDYILLQNGTLLTIQNMTWNGMQGFQKPIEDDFYVPYHEDVQLSTLAGAGIMGKTHSERGLTYFSVDLAGHMIPQYAPSAGYRALQMLLGRIGNLTTREPFDRTSDGLEAQLPAPMYGLEM